MSLLFPFMYIWHFHSIIFFHSRYFNENKAQRSVTAHYVSSRLAKNTFNLLNFCKALQWWWVFFKQWKYETNWVIFKMTKRNLLMLILMSHLQCECHQIFDSVSQITQSSYIVWNLVGSTAPVLGDLLFCQFSSLVNVANISKYVFHIYATLGIGSSLIVNSQCIYLLFKIQQQLKCHLCSTFSLCISNLLWKWPLSCYLNSLAGKDTSK